MLRFDGFYVAHRNETEKLQSFDYKAKEYLAFFRDGRVVSAGTRAEAAEVALWFAVEEGGAWDAIGSYTITGDRIAISTTVPDTGFVQRYEGSVANDHLELRLTWLGKELVRTYRF